MKKVILGVIGAVVLIFFVAAGAMFYLRSSSVSTIPPKEIWNGTFAIPGQNQPLTFVDGLAKVTPPDGKGGAPMDTYGEWSVRFWKETLRNADVDGDGIPDAVVLFGEKAGGTGTFVSLAVFKNQNGHPRFISLASVGDRPRFVDLQINGGQISFLAWNHFEDALAEWTYQVKDGALVLIEKRSYARTGAGSKGD